MIFKTITAVLASLLFSTALFAQSTETVTADGDNYEYTLETPATWVSDNATANQQELNAVFVPANSTWESASTVIYSSVTGLDESKNETVWDIISFDINMYKLSTPDLVVLDGEKISVDNGSNSATVIHLIGEKYGSYEAVAYIPNKGSVPFVVLSAETKEEFDANYANFERTVASYSHSNTQNVAKK